MNIITKKMRATTLSEIKIKIKKEISTLSADCSCEEITKIIEKITKNFMIFDKYNYGSQQQEIHAEIRNNSEYLQFPIAKYSKFSDRIIDVKSTFIIL